jgi:predicted metalloprotease with PDZ domain
VRRLVSVLTVFAMASAVLSAERVGFGLRLKQVGLVWRIEAVVPLSAAEKAGLVAGELVFQVGNIVFPSQDQLEQMVKPLKQGDVISLRILGRTEAIALTAEVSPDPPQ